MIGFLKFLLEAYDGMAVLTTIEPKKGLVVVRYPSQFDHDLNLLLASIHKNYNLIDESA